MRTGPFTFRFFSLAPLIKSAQTEKKNHKIAQVGEYFFSCFLKWRFQTRSWLRIAYEVIIAIHFKGYPHSQQVEALCRGEQNHITTVDKSHYYKFKLYLSHYQLEDPASNSDSTTFTSYD